LASIGGSATSAVCTEHSTPHAPRSAPDFSNSALSSPALAGSSKPPILAQTMPSSASS